MRDDVDARKKTRLTQLRAHSSNDVGIAALFRFLYSAPPIFYPIFTT
jgi:hypothetical protein